MSSIHWRGGSTRVVDSSGCFALSLHSPCFQRTLTGLLVARLNAMSTSAIKAPDCQSDNFAPSNDSVTRPEAETYDGYSQWLTWLQRLLGASALKIYQCEYTDASRQLLSVASLPVGLSSAPNTKLAEHCARTCSAVRNDGNGADAHSIVCVPDVAESDRQMCRHVLEIHRNAATTIDPETQTYLVNWAFHSLQCFLSTSQSPGTTAPVLSWMAEQVRSDQVSKVLFAKFTNILLDVSTSERCMLVRLKLAAGTVKNTRLLAVSVLGQAITSRQSSLPDVNLHNLDLALTGKTIPLKAIFQSSVEPCLPSMSSVSASHQSCSRLIIPVEHDHQWYAISLERDASRPYNQTLYQSLSIDVTNALALALVSDPSTLSVFAAIERRFRNWRIVAKQHVPRSMVLTVSSLLLCVLLFFPVEHRVSAPLAVEATERHVLIAPNDGFVKSVSATAGDRVKKGEILASLDDKDLQLEKRRLESEYSTNRQDYAKALATHDRVDITRLKEEALHIQTQLQQLRSQIDRMVITAPVDGIILSGNWDEFLGAAVAAGDTLFSLGSKDKNRLVLNVSEYDARLVSAGQSVGIRLAADPSHTLAASTTTVMPLTMALAGKNSVQVHAALNSRIQLRPGMQGVGKILIGRNSRARQWLGRLSARLIWLGWKIGVIK